MKNTEEHEKIIIVLYIYIYKWGIIKVIIGSFPSVWGDCNMIQVVIKAASIIKDGKGADWDQIMGDPNPPRPINMWPDKSWNMTY